MTCRACGTPLPDGARFCPACGAPVATAPAERRLVTVLFCDVVGSTALADRLDPEVLGAVMGEYTSLARAAIERYGGTVASFQGDGAVGLFGLTAADENDAVHAALAGLHLLASLPQIAEAAAQGIVLEGRVGIETGEVLGDVALAASGALAGDVLNTAARLQAVAEPGQVIAGEAAIRLLRHCAELRPLAPLRLKGKAEPVVCAVVLSAEVGPRRRSASPFVGRRRHLESLSRALEYAVADGSPVLATVVGVPGVGKSRLVDAFLSDLSETTVLRASVRASGEGTSLGPIAELVGAAAGGGNPAAAAKRLDEMVAGRSDAVALGAALRSLIGQGESGAVEHSWALRCLLEMLASRRPIVVVLDDLHWASSALINLVEDAVRWTRGPVLMLCATRPDLLDAHRSWGGGMQRAVTVTVGALEADESRQLADVLLGQRAFESERLTAAAEGNPLFLEQLAAEFDRVGGGWDPTTVPTTIRALLEARLDRCPSHVSRALSVASVAGSRFHIDVAEALGPELVDLRAVLREAERAHLAREVEPNVGAFDHALIRETAYRRLPKGTRAELHVGFAELLCGDDELAGTHLETAGALQAELGHRDLDVERRAGEKLAVAGARAFARLDLVTSSGLLGRAARLLPASSAARLELLPDLAVALMEKGCAADARVLLANAVEEAEAAASRRDAIRIRLQQLALLVYSDVTAAEIRTGIAESRSLLGELLGFGDDVGLAQGWIVVEYLHWMLGELAHVEDAAGRSVAHAEKAGRLREQVQAGGDQSVTLVLGPLPVGVLRELGEQRRTSVNPVVAAGGEAAVAAAAALANDGVGYRAAKSQWQYAVESGGLEWPGADQAVMALATVLLETGDPEGAEALAREGLETMERLGDVWVLNGATFIVPIALARQGRMEEAAALAERHDERYTWMGICDAVYRGMALSMASATRGRRDEALMYARQAARDACVTDSNLLQSLALEQLAHTLRQTDPKAAVAILQQVGAIDRLWGNVVGTERVNATLATWASTLEH